MKRYLGVDLHRTQFTVCTRLENGRTYLRQWPMRELKLFAGQLRPDDEIAVEATGNTRLFYDAVVKQVARVVVVNPGQFKVISQSVKKTDKKDAELLALAGGLRVMTGSGSRRSSGKDASSGWLRVTNWQICPPPSTAERCLHSPRRQKPSRSSSTSGRCSMGGDLIFLLH